MSGAVDQPEWGRGQSELLARRMADDEDLLRKSVRVHGSRHLKKLRWWIGVVRGDLGARGVITDLSMQPNGDPIAYYYVDPEPEPEPAVSRAKETAPPLASGRPRTQSFEDGIRPVPGRAARAAPVEHIASDHHSAASGA